MTENEETLQMSETDDTMTATAIEATQVVQSAAGSAAEDTHDARDEIINQQKSTIDTLLEHTKALNAQIAELLKQGVQITDGKTEDYSNPAPSLEEDYIPLRDLGAEFGKLKR